MFNMVWEIGRAIQAKIVIRLDVCEASFELHLGQNPEFINLPSNL